MHICMTGILKYLESRPLSVASMPLDQCEQTAEFHTQRFASIRWGGCQNPIVKTPLLSPGFIEVDQIVHSGALVK